jgi:hypothetical protein
VQRITAAIDAILIKEKITAKEEDEEFKKVKWAPKNSTEISDVLAPYEGEIIKL